MNQKEGSGKKEITPKQWAAGIVIVLLVIAALATWKYWPRAVEPSVSGPVGEKKVTIQLAGNPLETLAGHKDQKAAGFIVKEESAGSIAADQTIILTLPNNARWESIRIPKAESSLSFELVKIEGGTAELKAVGTSTSPTELVIPNTRINLKAGKTGPITVQVCGSAGLTGEFTIAQAVAPIKVTAAEKPSLVIGKRGQKLSDLTITETRSESIIKKGVIKIDLPKGIFLEGTPKAEVVSGDLKVGRVYQTNDKSINIEISKESTEVSSIRLRSINVYLDRMVPEGDAVLIVGGDAINETGGAPDLPWPASSEVTTVAAAEVFTKAPIKSKFTVGSGEYILNGVESTMDTASYLSNGSIYIPSKYISQSLGATETIVNTGTVAGTVTLIKEGKIVQLKVGSNSMLVNNVNVPIDAVPESVNSSIMLPLAPVAQAFGAATTWDAATNSVTIIIK